MSLLSRRLLVFFAAVAILSLSAEPARAQVWVNRQFGGSRGAGWWQYPGQLGGGQIVGSVPFGRGDQQVTFTAAQWQQLVQMQAQQTPVLSMAQWNLLVAAQAQWPQVGALSPRQQRQVNAMQPAADPQQQLAALQAALEQLQKLQPKYVPPRRAPADEK